MDWASATTCPARVAFAQAQVRSDAGASVLLQRAALDRMRLPHGRKFGLDIRGLGVALYAPTASGAFVYGHDGANAPAINTSMRINPDNGDAVIVLVTGHPTLASAIGSEWTLWQTGVADVLSTGRAVRSHSCRGCSVSRPWSRCGGGG